MLTHYYLSNNYPNPFNPVTTINYQIPENTHVQISVYNILGQKVKILMNKKQETGQYTIQWDGLNTKTEQVGSGVYFIIFKTDNYTKIQKMVLLR